MSRLAKLSGHLDNGNAVAIVSGYTTAGGDRHDMANVWIAKAPADVTFVPLIDNLLAAAPQHLLPPPLGRPARPRPPP